MKLRDPDEVEDMASVCLAEAVRTKAISVEVAESDEDVDWVGLGENIDWQCLADFFIKILPLFL